MRNTTRAFETSSFVFSQEKNQCRVVVGAGCSELNLPGQESFWLAATIAIIAILRSRDLFRWRGGV
jgi:hypothetical protein